MYRSRWGSDALCTTDKSKRRCCTARARLASRKHPLTEPAGKVETLRVELARTDEFEQRSQACQAPRATHCIHSSSFTSILFANPLHLSVKLPIFCANNCFLHFLSGTPETSLANPDGTQPIAHTVFFAWFAIPIFCILTPSCRQFFAAFFDVRSSVCLAMPRLPQLNHSKVAFVFRLLLSCHFLFSCAGLELTDHVLLAASSVVQEASRTTSHVARERLSSPTK